MPACLLVPSSLLAAGAHPKAPPLAACTVSASPLFLLVGAEDRHGWVGCVHQPPRPHAHRVGANSLVTRLPDEHSLYAVWCHLNAPPAAVAPRGPVCPCLAAFLVASPGGDLILCPFPGTSASNAVPRATLES